MAITDNKPIYIQIADGLMDSIIAGRHVAEGRMPSVRELASNCQVNANTAMRAFELLERDGIVYNRRGLGYFVSADAREHITERRKREFYSGELEYFFGRLRQIGVAPQQLKEDYERYLEQES